jgi:Flp pilus assembly protein TadD
MAVPPPDAAVPTTKESKKEYAELMAEGKRLLASEPARAGEQFGLALAQRPQALLPNIQMARAHIASGDLSKARPFAAKAIELDPNSSLAWNTLGRIELGEGNREAALTSFQRAVDEDEESSHAWNNLGYVHLLNRDYDAAVDALERATSGRGVTPHMWNNLGLAYEHLDRLEEARAAYRQAADAGSEKAAQSLKRLEGVRSIAE